LLGRWLHHQLVFVFCQDDVFLINIAFVYRFRTDGYRFIPVIALPENAPTLKTVIHPYDEPLYRFHVRPPLTVQRSHILTPSNRNPTKKPLLDDFQLAAAGCP